MVSMSRVLYPCVSEEKTGLSKMAPAQLAQIGRPVNQVPYSMQRRLFLLCGVIIDGGGVKGAAEHAQRIDLIQGGVECPHKKSP